MSENIFTKRLIEKAGGELEVISNSQPNQGQYSSVAKFEKAYVGYQKKLRAFAEKWPHYPHKLTFSTQCVPCVGKETIGGCMECKHFKKDNNSDLFQMEILKPKNQFNMENKIVVDITYLKKGDRKQHYQVVVAESEAEAKQLVITHCEAEKIVETSNLGKPLFKK